MRVREQEHRARRSQRGEHVRQETAALRTRARAPFEQAESQHEDGGDAVLEALAAELPERDTAERPRALVGGGAQVDEGGERDEPERPVPAPRAARAQATERDQAHAEQDEPGDIVAEVRPEIGLARIARSGRRPPRDSAASSRRTACAELGIFGRKTSTTSPRVARSAAA